MLKNGKYPYVLKKRIMSPYGHLSNDAAAVVINYLIDKGVRRFMLGHLSQNNNLPQIALKTVVTYLLNKGKKYMKDYELFVAPAKSLGKVLNV